MKPDPDKPYYSAYEKRYHSAYAQGMTAWGYDPVENKLVEEAFTSFFDRFVINEHNSKRVIEFGCGEGFVGVLIAKRSHEYVGVEYSVSAAERARARLAQYGRNATVLVDDITCLSSMADESFDVGCENSCIHMLVVDADRHKYLRNAYRLLKPGAPMLFANVGYNPDGYPGVVENYDEWIKIAGTDTVTPRCLDANVNDQMVKVKMPLIAARQRSQSQYKAELEAAGFKIVEWKMTGNAHGISILAIKPA